MEENKILTLCNDPSSKDEGFKLLIQTYQENVYWRIRRMVHFHEDANDVVQNTFIKVYRYLPDFKRQSALGTWIYRIATNESLSHLKKNKKHKNASVESMASELGDRLKADPYFDGTDTQILLITAIEQLPPKQRAVFNMRYFEEMPYKQMVEILETSEGSLKASYHHAVKKIESFLSEE